MATTVIASIVRLLVLFASVEWITAMNRKDYPYYNDPSDTVLSSNPYGHTLILNCTIAKVPNRKPVIHWYKNSPRMKKCLITVVSSCRNGSRPQFHVDKSQNSFYGYQLRINNVAASDIGCYWCHGMHCVNSNKCSKKFRKSKKFCLLPEDHYLKSFNRSSSSAIFPSILPSTSNGSLTLMPAVGGVKNTPSITPLSSPITTTLVKETLSITPQPSLMMTTFVGGVKISPSITSLSSLKKTPALGGVKESPPFTLLSLPPMGGVMVTPSIHINTTLSQSTLPVSSKLSSTTHAPGTNTTSTANITMATWLFISLAVCCLMCISTCILTAVTVNLGRQQLRIRELSSAIFNCSNPTTTSTEHEMTQERSIHVQCCVGANEQNHNPQFIGTYCLAHEFEEQHSISVEPITVYKESSADNPHNASPTQPLLPAWLPDSPGMRPGPSHSQIYHTLIHKPSEARKYDNLAGTPEPSLACYDYCQPVPVTQATTETQSTQNDYDVLFNDPDYSEITPEYSLAAVSDTSTTPQHTHRKRSLGMVQSISYDKLNSRHSSVYDYAYAHVTTAHNNTIDLIGLAEGGAYEVDSDLVSSLKKRKQMIDEGHYQIPTSTGQIDLQELRRHHSDSDLSKILVRHYPYQSIDCVTLKPENSYATLTK